jgi:hypothetical protein
MGRGRWVAGSDEGGGLPTLEMPSPNTHTHTRIWPYMIFLVASLDRSRALSEQL